MLKLMVKKIVISYELGIGIGDWGFRIGSNPQSPIFNYHLIKKI